MQPFSARVVPHLQGPIYSILGTDFQILLYGNQSRSDLTLLHALVHPNSGAPTHCHRTFEELYYLLQGELQITINSKCETIQAGTLVYIPQDTAHSYFNASQTSAQLLMWASPAGIEYVITGLSAALSTDRVDPQTQLEAIASQYDFIPVD